MAPDVGPKDPPPSQRSINFCLVSTRSGNILVLKFVGLPGFIVIATCGIF